MIVEQVAESSWNRWPNRVECADTTRKVYTFVPTQEWTKRWTDEDLYAKYGISASEIEFIEKVVRPMELTSDLFGDVAIGDSEDE